MSGRKPKSSTPGKITFRNETTNSKLTLGGQKVRLTVKQGQKGHSVIIEPGKIWTFQPDNQKLSLTVTPLELKTMLGDVLEITKPIRNGDWSIYIKERAGANSFGLDFVEVWRG